MCVPHERPSPPLASTPDSLRRCLPNHSPRRVCCSKISRHRTTDRVCAFGLEWATVSRASIERPPRRVLVQESCLQRRPRRVETLSDSDSQTSERRTTNSALNALRTGSTHPAHASASGSVATPSTPSTSRSRSLQWSSAGTSGPPRPLRGAASFGRLDREL